MAVTRKTGGFSGASVVVALEVVNVITVPGTCSVVVVICTAAVEAVAVSGALLKVVLLSGDSDVPMRTFLFLRESLVLSLRFLFLEMLNYGL